MKIILALTTLLLVGCSTTVPVTVKFPEAPKELQQQCPPLKTAEAKPELSELTKVIVTNYSEYHLCSNRIDGWIEWYNAQKKIFEALK